MVCIFLCVFMEVYLKWLVYFIYIDTYIILDINKLPRLKRGCLLIIFNIRPGLGSRRQQTNKIKQKNNFSRLPKNKCGLHKVNKYYNY